MNYDCLIIGAGVAEVATAIAPSQKQELKICLVDKQESLVKGSMYDYHILNVPAINVPEDLSIWCSYNLGAIVPCTKKALL